MFENATLRIEPGEFVAITGPSGGGKTTLMKVMLGLFEPTSGDVLIDGYPLSALGVQTVREQVGVVMQDDQLLSGSIQDNISFFDTQVDRAWVQPLRRDGRHRRRHHAHADGLQHAHR